MAASGGEGRCADAGCLDCRSKDGGGVVFEGVDGFWQIDGFAVAIKDEIGVARIDLVRKGVADLGDDPDDAAVEAPAGEVLAGDGRDGGGGTLSEDGEVVAVGEGDMRACPVFDCAAEMDARSCRKPVCRPCGEDLPDNHGAAWILDGKCTFARREEVGLERCVELKRRTDG